MKLEITPLAQQWFSQELQVAPGMGVRFYGKVYGNTNVHEGFSVGMSVDTPEKPLIQTEVDGQTYFIEENDEWFFTGYDLLVDYDAALDEPSYLFEKNAEYTK
ncbi:HesB/YadR/YfhF family protein [Enterococcus sp. BWR-S5]|uniref:HesB/YadR/YfhF family protein n=1 Tax=Enterococcus sp. BWR-S5 TaxID=2787714 RepID=UPI001920536B|nr:iron-sulfur cluster biosynthesis protein [Enterococcus sp. BWR-S5]MBL1224753.1 iron-sulfur cluster biosynthesis protein [Enterococcus sp. BWR-S5]